MATKLFRGLDGRTRDQDSQKSGLIRERRGDTLAKRSAIGMVPPLQKAQGATQSWRPSESGLASAQACSSKRFPRANDIGQVAYFIAQSVLSEVRLMPV